ncbi:MAG: CPBP family glutamic-type intramembrane protease [Bacteroidota bacterium]
MNLFNYFYLYLAYGIALLSWHLYSSYVQPAIETNRDTKDFKYPWLEFVFALLAAIATILVGQLYMKGLLFSRSSSFGFLTESINQLLIFSPFPLLLIIRKHRLSTAWFPTKGKIKSIAIGLVIAMIALVVLLLLKGRSSMLLADIGFIYSYKNLPQLVQVFAEDFAISVCLFRLMAWIGAKRAILLISLLFAASHIPAMLYNDVALGDFTGLLFDALLGFFALTVVSKSKNFLWFWMIHYAMDMTQFLN